MLRFEQVPPQKPEDITFTDKGLREIRSSADVQTFADLAFVGKVLGLVITANFGEALNGELLSGIVEHLEKQAGGKNPVTTAIERHLAQQVLGVVNV